jgi:hypothetical protein
MPKAAERSTTATHAKLNGTIDLADMMEPIGCDWIEPGKARITLRSSSGQIITYTLTTASLVKGVNIAVDAINSRLGPIMDGDDAERIAAG